MKRQASLIVLLALLMALAPARGSAQDAAQSPVANNVISANPFMLLLTWFNAEYERKVSDVSTIGLRISTLSLGDELDDDTGYYSGRLFWRYYPTSAFKGFFFGVGAGATSLDGNGDNATVMGAGFDLGYSWLLGKKQNFYISLGAGADRLFGGDLGDASAFIPTVRIINVGFAF